MFKAGVHPGVDMDDGKEKSVGVHLGLEMGVDKENQVLSMPFINLPLLDFSIFNVQSAVQLITNEPQHWAVTDAEWKEFCQPILKF